MILESIVKSLAIKVLKPGMLIECMNNEGRSYTIEKGKTYTVGNAVNDREMTLKEFGPTYSFHATRFRQVSHE